MKLRFNDITVAIFFDDVTLAGKLNPLAKDENTIGCDIPQYNEIFSLFEPVVPFINELQIC